MNILNALVNKIFHPTAASGAPASIAAPENDPSAQITPSATPVDIDQVLGAMQKAKSVTLNWRTSIVDLMKLLDMDSGLESRKQLAQELGYNGSTSDTATMNTWLHEAVMKRVAANGGKVPSDIKH